MNGDGEFDPHDVRLMRGLAQRVTALRPELVNNVATVGELAWVWGMSHHDDRDTWRRRLWYHRAEMVGWGWAYLPLEVTRSDRTMSVVEHAYLVWQAP
jgi:hypothetical protein